MARSAASWLTMATTTLNTIVIASTGGSVRRILARSTCHIGSGAMRRSWKPRFSLGIDGVASEVAMNIDMKPTRKTSVQKPPVRWDGLATANTYPIGNSRPGCSRLRRLMSRLKRKPVLARDRERG